MQSRHCYRGRCRCSPPTVTTEAAVPVAAVAKLPRCAPPAVSNGGGGGGGGGCDGGSRDSRDPPPAGGRALPRVAVARPPPRTLPRQRSRRRLSLGTRCIV